MLHSIVWLLFPSREQSSELERGEEFAQERVRERLPIPHVTEHWDQGLPLRVVAFLYMKTIIKRYNQLNRTKLYMLRCICVTFFNLW